MTNLLQDNGIHALQQHFEAVLRNALPADNSRLHEAMRYTTLNAGKRLRPILVYTTGHCFNATLPQLDPAAIAIELIHCYSLVHDDLPAMDDDDLRRGKPSCHKQFDEATAILVGDALQALAFELLSTAPGTPQSLALIHTLAHASGSQGMVAGQSLDMLASNETTSLPALQAIHRLKTGALFSAAIRMGALAAGVCDDATLQLLTTFSQHLGLAFQIRDDILDVEATTQTLGKTSGKDQTQHKATYPALLGLDGAKTQLTEQITQAKDCLHLLSAHDTQQLSELMTIILT